MTASSLTASSASVTHAGGARLLADIGGTNARFALEFGPGRIELIEVLACNDHLTLAAAVRAYLASPAVAEANPGPVRHAAIAIANPVVGDYVRMTNHHWEFSIEALRRECGFEVLEVVNDFSALARFQHGRQIQVGAYGGGQGQVIVTSQHLDQLDPARPEFEGEARVGAADIGEQAGAAGMGGGRGTGGERGSGHCGSKRSDHQAY